MGDGGGRRARSHADPREHERHRLSRRIPSRHLAGESDEGPEAHGHDARHPGEAGRRYARDDRRGRHGDDGVEVGCRVEGCAVSIVSHKTEYGHYDPERINLRDAARQWMAANGVVEGEFGISASNIFFEGSRSDKLARIAALSCTHFIDDLEEVLLDPGFPPNVERILFSEHEEPNSAAPYVVCASWRDIEDRIFARH